MAASEDQAQPVVDEGVHTGRTVGACIGVDRSELGFDCGFTAEQLLLLGEDLAPAESVDRPVAGRRRDPCTGVLRHAPVWPRLQGGDERFLDRLLGEIEVAEDADQCGDGAPLFVPEQALDDGPSVRVRRQGARSPPVSLGDAGRPAQPATPAASAEPIGASPNSQIGRTSIEPCFAAGIRPASSIASSRSRASTR